MKCQLCGLEFKEEEGQTACSGCHMSRSCGLIKCPNCGYEAPKESNLIKSLKRWKEKLYETK
jgi:rubredoxin